jgi:hypothetical protein
MREKYDVNSVMNPYIVEPSEVTAGDKFGYKIVACIWSLDEWCAFRAPTNWSDDRVAKEGDEILEDVANSIFPTLASLGMVYGNI